MDELNRAAEVLAAADEVALACHLNPDADALGSMLGLAGFLQVSRDANGVFVSERTASIRRVGRRSCPGRRSSCRWRPSPRLRR